MSWRQWMFPGLTLLAAVVLIAFLPGTKISDVERIKSAKEWSSLHGIKDATITCSGYRCDVITANKSWHLICNDTSCYTDRDDD